MHARDQALDEGAGGALDARTLGLMRAGDVEEDALTLHQRGLNHDAVNPGLPAGYDLGYQHSNLTTRFSMSTRFIYRLHVALLIALSFCCMTTTTPPILLHQWGLSLSAL